MQKIIIMHDEYSFRYIYGLITTTVKSLPYVSEGIPAGFPSPAADCIGDRIDLNEVLILSPGATYYARVRDYYLVEEELEQGDGILFDTRLAPRTGDLAFCEVCGERVLKYIRKRGRELWFSAAERTTRFLSTATPKRGCWASLRSSSNSGGFSDGARALSTACTGTTPHCQQQASLVFSGEQFPSAGLVT